MVEGWGARTEKLKAGQLIVKSLPLEIVILIKSESFLISSILDLAIINNITLSFSLFS